MFSVAVSAIDDAAGSRSRDDDSRSRNNDGGGGNYHGSGLSDNYRSRLGNHDGSGSDHDRSNGGSRIIDDNSRSSGSDQFGACSDEVDDIGCETDTS